VDAPARFTTAACCFVWVPLAKDRGIYGAPRMPGISPLPVKLSSR
jgi:hypothetical protein